jgi:hypothetical protein
MTTHTQRCYSSSTGTLTVLYQYNAEKKKNRLDHFSLQQEDQPTKIDLSKIWINNWPASHLKGFKSWVMPEVGVQFIQNHDIFDVTVQGSKFTTISLTIKVLGETEQVLSIEVPERLSVAGLKKIISRKLEIADLGRINLQYGGYALDSSNTIEECGFENGIELTLTLLSKTEKKPQIQEKITNEALEMCTTFAFNKLNSTKQFRTKPATSESHLWEIVHPGLSLIGTCANKVCKAFEKKVYVRKGMGTFNMAEECSEATCSGCQKPFEKEVTNCGFYECLYTIKGMMEDGTKFNEQDKMTPKGVFLSFEETVNGRSNITKWKYLNIVTKPSV